MTSTILIAGIAVIGTLLLVFSKAATPTTSLTLSPPSGIYGSTNNFTVTIREDSSTQPVYAVGAILNYDATKLDFVSANNTGSPFTGIAQLSSPAGSGKVNINLFIPSVPGQAGPGSTTGSQIVANLTFKAKAGVSSSTAMTFTGPATANNGVFSSADNSNTWNGVTTGGTYTIDSTAPTVTWNSPASGAVVAGNAVSVSANVSDNNGVVSSVVLIPGAGKTPINMTGSAGVYTANWDTTQGFTDGSYYVLSITATDPSGNATTTTRTVQVLNSKPDLVMTPSSVTLSPANPVKGDVVSVSAVIQNGGTSGIAAGTSKSIALKVDGTTVQTIIDTQAIAAGSSITLNFTTPWTAVWGTHNIVVTADSANQIAELSESNNDGTKPIVVYANGDVDNNGLVSQSDLNLVLFNWGSSAQTRATGDLTGDGNITQADLNLVLFNWGK